MGASVITMISSKVVAPLILILAIFESQVHAHEENGRDKKLFSLFSVVTFPNDECTAKSDSTMYGTCLTSTECNSASGTVDGNCASGFGVCCTWTLSSCSTTITQNRTYISNPSYPTTYSTSGSCAYTVTPISTDICQLRLDFDNFDITETTAGVCTDSFAAAGPTSNNPNTVCGTLTTQHMYVEQGRSSTASTLTFTIATGGTWKIKVTQIECSSLMRAPHDCDQYLTGITGNAISYNWYGAVQLQNTDFVTCIRREKGYCGMAYSQAQGTTIDSFDLDDNAAALNGQGNVGAAIMGYINIPNGLYADTFSGIVFTAASTSTETSAGVVTVTEGHRYRILHTVHSVASTSYEGYNIVFNQTPCE